MMTQYEYWLINQRYEALDEKMDKDLLSRAELDEFLGLQQRIQTAFSGCRTLDNAIATYKLHP